MTAKLDVEGIRERHEEEQEHIEHIEHEVRGMQNDPNVDFEVEYSGADDSHTDRGNLLTEVDRLQSELEVVSVIDRYLGGGWTMQLANALLKAKDKDPLPEQTK